MIRILCALLFGLTLTITVACSKKKEPDPTPTLEGFWLVKDIETNAYNADGSVRSQSGLVPQSIPHTYEFTTSQLTIREGGGAQYYKYTRSNDILILNPIITGFSLSFAQTILELTTNKLLLQDKRSNTQSGYTITLFHMVK